MKTKLALVLAREEVKLLRRILACGTWDVINLSKDEEKLINRLHNDMVSYLTDEKE